MRRDMWLAGVGGAVIGSWLTLIAVQFEFRGWPAVSLSEAQATAPDNRAASSLAGLTNRTPAASTPQAPTDSQAAEAGKPVATEPKPPAKADGAMADATLPAKPQDEASAAGNSEASAAASQPAAPAASTTAAASETAVAAMPAAQPPAPAAEAMTAPATAAPSATSSTPDTATTDSASGPASDPKKSNDTAALPAANEASVPAPAAPQATAQTQALPAQHSATRNGARVAVPTPRPESPEELAAKNVLQAKLAQSDTEKPEDGDSKKGAATTAPAAPSSSSPAIVTSPTAAVQSDAARGEETDTADADKKSARKPGVAAGSDAAGSQAPVAGQPGMSQPVTSDPAANAQTPDGAAPNTPPSTPASPGQSSPAAADQPATGQSAAPATKTVQIVRPFSDQAGILTVGGRSIQLAGVQPMDTNRSCTDEAGKSWPCGIAARTALRMFLRGRTVDCDMPASAVERANVTAACRYAKTDLSDWLVRNGWAEPAAGSPLGDANQEARDQKRGIYGNDPRKTGKSTLAPPPAPENPLNPI